MARKGKKLQDAMDMVDELVAAGIPLEKIPEHLSSMMASGELFKTKAKAVLTEVAKRQKKSAPSIFADIAEGKMEGKTLEVPGLFSEGEGAPSNPAPSASTAADLLQDTSLHTTPLPAKEDRLLSMIRMAGVKGEGSALQRGAARLAQSVGAEGAVLGGGGTISNILGSIAKGVIKHPIVGAIDAVGFGLPLLGLAKDAANAVSRSVTGDPLIGGISTDQALEMERQVRKEQRRREVENQARAQRLAQNTVSLIQNAPLVAQQVMAGRRLPKGAVVIGGTPRVDLMQQMADQMSQGAFQNQDPLQQLAMEQ